MLLYLPVISILFLYRVLLFCCLAPTPTLFQSSIPTNIFLTSTHRGSASRSPFLFEVYSRVYARSCCSFIFLCSIYLHHPCSPPIPNRIFVLLSTLIFHLSLSYTRSFTLCPSVVLMILPHLPFMHSFSFKLSLHHPPRFITSQPIYTHAPLYHSVCTCTTRCAASFCLVVVLFAHRLPFFCYSVL
jgi:hypothetical protein